MPSFPAVTYLSYPFVSLPSSLLLCPHPFLSSLIPSSFSFLPFSSPPPPSPDPSFSPSSSLLSIQHEEWWQLMVESSVNRECWMLFQARWRKRQLSSFPGDETLSSILEQNATFCWISSSLWVFPWTKLLKFPKENAHLRDWLPFVYRPCCFSAPLLSWVRAHNLVKVCLK